ncbi:serine recombinase [Vallitalea longa]|uniref:Serine recombinase n=1 Tax=Vallitalea longa TaxID=2936439 RepID=A0A9W6DD02_9FIRM|nr:recombinase family protein [Vallitalea longa]GKX27811.1 serine recombinase [Vallitalea longa]
MECNIKGLRAIALYRVSTDRQDEAMQKKSCQDFCTENHVKLIEEYTEIDVSGFKVPLKERNELIDILIRAENRDFDLLLIYNNDRLTRRSDEAPHILQVLSNNDIRVFETLTNNEIRTDSHMDKLINFFNSWTAEFESIKTSMRVKSAFAEKNEKGRFLGGLPYGYRLIRTNDMNRKGQYISRLVVDSEEAKVVKIIFDLYMNKNMGTVRIANYLNSNNFYTRKKKYYLNHNMKLSQNEFLWRASTIIRILKNPVYIGLKSYNKTRSTRDKVIRNSQDNYKIQPYNKQLRLISDKDYYHVQDLIEKRKKNKNKLFTAATISDNALCSGLIYCRCGCKLKTGYSYNKYHRKKDNKDIKKKVYYYCCPNHIVNKEKHKEITQKTIYGISKYDSIINEVIANEIKDFSVADFNKMLSTIECTNYNKQYELNSFILLREKLQKLIYKYEMAIDECLLNNDQEKADIFVKNINRNKDKLAKLDIEIQKITDYVDSVKENVKKLKDKCKFEQLTGIYNSCSLNEKKAIISKLVSKITVCDDEIVIDFIY